MKLPQSAPSTFDRVATREELFQVLEVLGGFEEPQATTELAQTRDPLACLETDSLITPSEILDELTSGVRSDCLENLIRLTPCCRKKPKG